MQCQVAGAPDNPVELTRSGASKTCLSRVGRCEAALVSLPFGVKEEPSFGLGASRQSRESWCDASSDKATRRVGGAVCPGVAVHRRLVYLPTFVKVIAERRHGGESGPRGQLVLVSSAMRVISYPPEQQPPPLRHY
ncbi:unnamed protein product [Pleuronectes platessa]|uniref:Uncharacterized protein n=1 Tax=Pleuronectes platessa TaxID=8262 RepID=A0A9N7UXA0_PLEPL|nr:unnamed protein product [Pleuronectes platessa]